MGLFCRTFRVTQIIETETNDAPFELASAILKIYHKVVSGHSTLTSQIMIRFQSYQKIEL